MKGIAILMTVFLMGMGVAHSATPTVQGVSSAAEQACEAQAAAKKLAGAAKTSFIGKCVKTAPAADGASAKATQCEKAAADKKLAGAAKNSFIQKCVKTDAATDKASQCEKAAADKKLAGAAKNSFIQKCVKTA
ncbi:hypothetical protein CUC44_12635 [Aeromonas lusitana]|uniref:PsiF repeat-containing protein n=2 Tax=Aeromonas lusitana TaxID=931529 RepID=A0A2M8H8N1_9GAMM|nr:hypothetical protein CUC44_12635 [Aeromonas lusitana]